MKLRSVLKNVPNLEMKIAPFSCFKIETGNIRFNDHRKFRVFQHFKFCIGVKNVLVGWWPSYGRFELNLNPLFSNNIHNISPSDTKLFHIRHTITETTNF